MGQISPIFFFHYYESSSTFTVPKGVKKIDVFCVGGGGGGSSDFSNFGGAAGGTGTFYVYEGGYGGGGGYTATKLGVDVNPGDIIAVTVGAGGTAKSIDGGNGSSSSVGDICSAAGGTGGVYPSFSGVVRKWNSSTGRWEIVQLSSNGGSAGGRGSYHYSDNGEFSSIQADKGAIDGSNANPRNISNSNRKPRWIHKGQGTTTRYFGESTGTLYSTGGCGGTNRFGGDMVPCGSITDQIANTGNGGNGQGRLLLTDYTVYSANAGSSGICIIRWDDQKS